MLHEDQHRGLQAPASLYVLSPQWQSCGGDDTYSDTGIAHPSVTLAAYDALGGPVVGRGAGAWIHARGGHVLEDRYKEKQIPALLYVRTALVSLWQVQLAYTVTLALAHFWGHPGYI
jgi:hypothetical protein